jgi:hypothetical protein
MAKVKIQGHASGTGILTVTAPNTSTDRTITLPDESVTLGAATPSIDDNGDATAITITSAEKVGIGTTSPSQKLHVEDITSSNTSTYISIVGGTGGNAGITFGDSDADLVGGVLFNNADNALRFFKNGFTEAMRIDSSGNLGLGTTSPNYRLHVNTSVDGDFASLIHNTDADNGQGLMIRAGADSGEAILSLRNQASSEKMRVDASGNLSIGTYANPPSSSFIRLTSIGIVQSGRTGTGNQPAIEFFNGNGVVGSIYTGGTTTTYYTSSDYRLKENVNYDWDATTRLKQLKPARFNFIADDSVTFDGFLAHEVKDIVPEAIGGEKDAMMNEEYEVTPAVEEVRDEEGNITTEAVEAVMGTRSVPDYQGIDQSKLVPLLVKTIQELEARITALET